MVGPDDRPPDAVRATPARDAPVPYDPPTMPTTCPGSLQALHSSLTDAVDRVDGAALAWAASGAMSLTGAADGPPRQAPVPVATGLEAAAGALSQFGGIEVDGPALLGERAAIAGLGRAGLGTPGIGGSRNNTFLTFYAPILGGFSRTTQILCV